MNDDILQKKLTEIEKGIKKSKEFKSPPEVNDIKNVKKYLEIINNFIQYQKSIPLIKLER